MPHRSFSRLADSIREIERYQWIRRFEVGFRNLTYLQEEND